MAQNELEIGNNYTLDNFEEIFDTSFGYPVGINYRNPDNRNRFIVLLSKEGGPYSDEVSSSDRFFYVGEGLEGDQTKTPRNQALIDAVTESFPIYFFYQSEDDSDWSYQDLVDVVDYQKVEKDGRRVFRFKMRKLNIANFKKYEEVSETVLEADADPDLTEETEEVEVTRKARSSAFARKVKEEYDYSCAVCGSSRKSPEGVPEVEAAHIYPKEEGGRDNIQNGMALCRLHHWAFDHGWFTVTDELKVKVQETDEIETPDVIKDISGNLLNTPEADKNKPHQVYLRGHRELHWFK